MKSLLLSRELSIEQDKVSFWGLFPEGYGRTVFLFLPVELQTFQLCLDPEPFLILFLVGSITIAFWCIYDIDQWTLCYLTPSGNEV